MDKDRATRMWNQHRLRWLRRHSADQVEVFCAHDTIEYEQLAGRATNVPGAPSAATRWSATMANVMARHGGTGSVVGLVYSDWNGNGVQDADDRPLENIPVRLIDLGNATTSRAGEFSFINVPIGMLQVGIDLSSLPVDFDPPPVPQVQVSLGRGDTKRLSFGLIPLGTVVGKVIRDANNNGAPTLRISELAWDADGWPISGGP